MRTADVGPDTNAVSAPARNASLANAYYENSIGMRFIPLKGSNIWLSIWETRVQDYDACVKDSGVVWPKPGFDQTGDHPAVNVNWENAAAFCRWLTDKEHESGILKAKDRYRLPTDEEWSFAAGMGPDSGATPEERSKNAIVWPWGSSWPPRQRVGNYAPELKIDRFDNTSAVGSFPPNKKGFYDLGGNAWEWCEDWYNAAGVMRVLRGGSWAESQPGYLLAGYRFHGTMNLSNDDIGFRVVLQRQ
jgi:formylglycine-generating enzyme required for sulfatase activity